MSDTENGVNKDTQQEPAFPEPTASSPTTQPTRERESRSGALKSSLTLDLHTHYAIRLWDGRRKEQTATADVNSQRPPRHIFSMPQVISRAGQAYQASVADNPYADALLVKLEDAIEISTDKVQQVVHEISEILKSIPVSITLTDVVSVSPLNIGVYSSSPLGYRCVWLLVGYDQLAMKVFQAFHYGLISRATRDQYLDKGGYAIRQIYSIVQNYRAVAVTRNDILTKTPAGLKAIELYGEPDADIMSGKVRSSFSARLSPIGGA
ncbi:PFL_4669 family integrating conjugative element protein [Pectobacterium aquaticum]|uniref:PFL_4669 family integrating conjugative element protein n=1 Tax=Pectobacterium aquaticum TaxID=2204145 RepID=UPI001F0D0858|nr:TIGR03761 family integrating conjugative element protein [Pectobacterium aquaticum]MCH5049197.1 TIGR03761 family integrating conjugative element protein [Pectobacterium aquaticum]